MKRRSRGDDAIYYDRNKRRYFGAVSLGYGPDGRRIRRKVSGRTRTQVKDRLRELHTEIDAGIRTDVNCTVAMCLNDWVSQEHNSKSPRTRRVYESLAKSIVTEIGSIRLTALTARDVDRALKSLARTRSTGTMSRLHGILVAAIRRAQVNDLVLCNVAALVSAPPGAPRDGRQRP